MSGKSSEELFTLVKSLSMSEKRHFKSYASMGNTKENMIYLQLFNVIEIQTKYNEERILKKIPEIKPEYLSSKKNHLTELILESLQIYHSADTINAKLSSLISKIEILYNKRLFKLCGKQIKKAKEIAEQFDRHEYLSLILIWELKRIDITMLDTTGEAQLDKIFLEHRSVAKKITDGTEYMFLINKIFQFHRKGIIPNATIKNELKKIIHHPLLTNNKKNAPYWELMYYYRILFLYNYILCNWQKSYFFQKKLIENFETKPHQVNNLPLNYLDELNNFLVCCCLAHKEDDFNTTIAKAKSFTESLPHPEKFIAPLIDGMHTVLTNYNERGEFQKGVEIVGQIENIFNKVSDTINKPKEIALYYAFAYCYFGLGDFSKSLFWLNKIINDRDTAMRNDIRVFARLLNIIIHFEIGNEQLLEYVTKSTYRFLLHNTNSYRIEIVILDFLRKGMSKINSKNELLQAFKKFKAELENLKKDADELIVFTYVDFISWLTSKIENRNFADVVREKARTIRKK